MENLEEIKLMPSQETITTNMEFWMTNLPQKLRTIPVIHLAIPGSHDSTTYSITWESPIAPDAESFIQRIKFIGAPLRFIMSHWSRTQDASIAAQLRHGVRYFDLRIATNKTVDKRFYFVHGLYSAPIDQAFAEFKDFLDTHPGEVIILDCQHFYAFHQPDHEDLMMMLSNTFGHKLVPYTPRMEHLTLEYMTTQFRYQVFVVYRSDAARFGQPLLWPSSSFPTPWPNTVSKVKLIDYLNNGLRHRNPFCGYVSQFVLTPTKWFVCRNIFGSLKSMCALNIDKDKYKWLSKQKPGQGGLNIVISDFVDCDNYQFCKEIVELNLKLMEIMVEKGEVTKNGASLSAGLTPVND